MASVGVIPWGCTPSRYPTYTWQYPVRGLAITRATPTVFVLIPQLWRDWGTTHTQCIPAAGIYPLLAVSPPESPILTYENHWLMITLYHQPVSYTHLINSSMDPHTPTPQNALEFTTGPLACLSVNGQSLSPPPDHHFRTPHTQLTMTMKQIEGTQNSKDSHSTGISFQVSNKVPYGSPEIPTLLKEGEFMSLLRETIKMLQESRQRKPQSPIPPEHTWSTLLWNGFSMTHDCIYMP